MSRRKIEEELVSRFVDGGVYTPLEFIQVINALLPYADENTMFFQTAPQQVEWAKSLDQNEILIKLEPKNDILYPVATSGVESPITKP